MEKIEQN